MRHQFLQQERLLLLWQPQSESVKEFLTDSLELICPVFSCTDDWTPHWAYVRDGTGEKAAKAIAKCYKKAKKANKA